MVSIPLYLKIDVLHPSTSFNVIEDASAANSRKANLADCAAGHGAPANLSPTRVLGPGRIQNLWPAVDPSTHEPR